MTSHYNHHTIVYKQKLPLGDGGFSYEFEVDGATTVHLKKAHDNWVKDQPDNIISDDLKQFIISEIETQLQPER